MKTLMPLLICLLLSCQGSSSRRGLDTRFGTAGKVTTAIGTGDDEALAVAVQPDGKIIVAGRSYSSGQSDFALARYDETGALDTTFGTAGKVTTDFSGGNDAAYAVAVLADGSILAAGSAATLLAFAKYTSAGILDASFDTDGKLVVVANANQDEIRALAVQADGLIVAAGFTRSSTDFDMVLVRLSSSGVLDSTFDGDGKKLLALGSGDDKAFALAIQNDGKIVVTGSSTTSSLVQFVATRLTTLGELDISFGAPNGFRTIFSSLSVGLQETATGLGVLTDGSLVLSGNSAIGGTQKIFVARIDSSGNLVNEFSGDGKLRTVFSSAETTLSHTASAQVVQPDGNILIVGKHQSTTGSDFGVIRMDATGTPDILFGTDGIQTLDFGSNDEASAVVLVGSSASIVVGKAHNGTDYDFALAKYFQ